jgi:hypothetical protein
MALELKHEGAMWPATTSFVAPEEQTAPGLSERAGKHLSLVSAAGQDTPRADIPSHTHFLKASTIRVYRERPVEWNNHMIRFTAGCQSTSWVLY